MMRHCILKRLMSISALLLMAGMMVMLVKLEASAARSLSLRPPELVQGSKGEARSLSLSKGGAQALGSARRGDVPGLTFVVNSSADGTDVSPGDQVCATAAGVCTLRAAIQESNAYGGDDFIDLRADVYTLTIAGPDEDQSATGDLDIVDHLTIQGAGESSTVVDGNQLDRIFHIIGPFDVNLIGMTLQNGKTIAGEDGGAIFNSTNANTSLSDSIVRDNEADQWGGGIANSDSAQIELLNVTVQGNRAGLIGGGIDNHDGVVTLDHSEVISNTAAANSGGGVYNDGTFRIYNTWVGYNQAAQDGGGIFNFDSLVVERSTVSNNQATSDAGGILNHGDLVLHNATVSSNQAGRDAGGVFNINTMAVYHATIYQNQATNNGGGLFNDGFATIKNTIVASNTGGNCVRYHTIESQGHNLESTNSCGFNGTGDLVNTSASLGALQDNGGPTMTHAPLTGSAAVDAIAPVNGCLTVDQRDIDRPQGSGCDIGAHEYNFVDLLISQSDSPDPVYAGQPLSYELNVSNQGESDAFGVVVTDTLAAGTTFVSATGNGWTCVHTAGVVVCERPLLILSNTAPPILITVNAPDTGGTITNHVAVDSIITDVDMSNNSASITTTVDALADLGISFTSNPTPIEVNDVLTFTVNVDNYGPSSADTVTVTVELPPNQVSYQNATGTGWSCSHLNRLITCTRPNLSVGSAPSITVEMVALQGDDTITSELAIESATSDLNTANNSTIAIVGDTTTQRADLSISILDTPDPIGTNASLLYTLQVNNAGLHQAPNVTVTNQLPPQATFVSASGTGWSCNESGGTVTCTRAALAVGAAPDILITVTTPSEPTLLRDEASITSAIEDQNPSNNSAIETTDVGAVADLSIALSDTPDPVNEGSLVQYTLSVQNHGPSTASAIVVTDTLPAELFYIDASGVDWSCGLDGNVVSCSRATLPPGPAPDIILQVGVNPSRSTLISNSAAVSSETPDPDPSNNRATETTARAVADLSLTMSDSPDPVSAGANLTYIVRANNAGPTSAISVTLENTLPTGTTFVSAAGSGWNCDHSSGVVNCTTASLPVGSAPDIMITVQAPTTSGTISNQATISAVTSDSDASNNSASQSTQVAPLADLSVTTTGDGDPVTPGATLDYSVQVANAGPSHSGPITVTHQLPPEVSYLSHTGTGWTCTHNSGTLTCVRASLGIESAPLLNVSVQGVTDSAQVLIPISVSATSVDPNQGNNNTSVPLGVSNIADLSINVSDSRDPVDASSPLSYSLAVNNAGPATANDVIVTHQLPSEASFVSASGSGWSCSESVGTLTCQRSSLAVGAAPEIVVWVTTPSEGGVLSTDAQISASTQDLMSNNNQDSELTTVTAIADLELAYTAVSNDRINVVYTLQATNNGPSAANSVVLTQMWPAGLTYNRATGSGWSCDYDSASGTLTCTHNRLSAGASSEVNVILNNSTGDASGLLEADVRSATTERETNNNAAQQALPSPPPPPPSADLSISISDNPDPVEVGQPLTYTVSVQNNGPDAAEQVVVTHDLPSGTTFGSASGTDWSCSETNRVLTCTTANLSLGSAPDITVLVTAPTTTDRITTNASVAASTPQDNLPSNNQASQSTTVVDTTARGADLGVSVSDSPDPVLSGQLLTYLIEVQNYGGDEAQSLVLDNELSSRVAFHQASGDGWSCTYDAVEHDVSCTRDRLAVGAAPPISIQVSATDDSGTLLNNTIISAATDDTDQSNNTHVERTALQPMADLSITQSGPSQVMYAGQLLTYTLTVNNAGPSPATSLIMTNTLPSDLTNPIVQQANGWNCDYQSSTHTIICTKGQLDIGSSSVIIMGTAPNEGGMMINRATVSAQERDINIDNNDMSNQQMPIVPMADLSVAIDDEMLQTGDQYLLTYTIKINNNGPSSANNVTLSSDLPDGLTITTMEGKGWSCKQNNTGALNITCQTPTLPTGAAPHITIGLQAPPGVTVEHTATVNAAPLDNNSGNNQAAITTDTGTGSGTQAIYLPIIARP